jgi:hypothetical protein
MLYEYPGALEYVAEFYRAGCIVNGNEGLENMQVLAGELRELWSSVWHPTALAD